MTGHFICQISEIDWLISREIGVYGNREGSESDDGVNYFSDSPRGDSIIQSIIEDLIGMRKGDLIFFHVINTEEGESSIHGPYRVREEPFYNDEVWLWKSSTELIYPYRFCFEPHPEHIELCKHDASVLVSEFYRSIENRDIRSILTLEREVRGAAHAVKTITGIDADGIIKLLYRDFHNRHCEKTIDFKPRHMKMSPLRDHISRIGKIEFAIKALVAYKLGRKDPGLTTYIPACRKGDYDFLIESFIGQTTRRPTDILCTSCGASENAVTIIEAKTTRAGMDDLIQSLKYLEIFKLRNMDKNCPSYKTSICLLAQKFHPELIQYLKVRNKVIPWEEIILLKYTPAENGKNATFGLETKVESKIPISSITYSNIDIDDLHKLLSSSPNKLYSLIGKKISPKVSIELKSSKENFHILEKYFNRNGQKISLGHLLVYEVDKIITLGDLSMVMENVKKEASYFRGALMAVEPLVMAKNYDDLTKFFIEKYNEYEIYASRQPIMAYLLSKT